MTRLPLTAAQIDDVLGDFATSFTWTAINASPTNIPPPRSNKRRCEYSETDAFAAVREYLSVGRWNDLLPAGDALDTKVADQRLVDAARVLGFREATPRAAKKQKIEHRRPATVDSGLAPPPAPPVTAPAASSRSITPSPVGPANVTAPSPPPRPATPFSPATTAAAVVDFFVPVPTPTVLEQSPLRPAARASIADQPQQSAPAAPAFFPFANSSTMLVVPRVVQPC